MTLDHYVSMRPTLAGTGLVADDLYLMAHHETTGKPYIQPRALGLGLAAALLTELVTAEAITLSRQANVAATSHSASGDPLTGELLALIRSESQPRPVRDWLLFIARTATGDVAFRLEHAGYLVRTDRRVPWQAQRWVPTDAHSAFAPLLRACAALDATRPLTVYSAVLAGLATACGLGFRLTEYAPFRITRSAAAAVLQLEPVAGELVRQTQAAVDSAVLSHRA